MSVDHWIYYLAACDRGLDFEPHLSPDRHWSLGAQSAGPGLTVERAEVSFYSAVALTIRVHMSHRQNSAKRKAKRSLDDEPNKQAYRIMTSRRMAIP